MSRLHEQIKQMPGIAYTRPLTDRESAAREQREKNRAWQWYYEQDQEDEVEQSFTLADGTVFTEKQRRH